MAFRYFVGDLSVRVQVRSKVRLDPETVQSIDRRLHFVLGRFGDRVDRVVVHLAALRGPRGADEKHCRIVVQLIPSEEITVEDVEVDLETVFGRAAERMARSVRRAIERQREP